MIRIHADIENWTCEYKECGARCCKSGITLTKKDIIKIIKLGYSPEEFLDFDDRENVFKIKGKDEKCYFLGENLECTIWKNKPILCEILPFRIYEVSYSDEPIMHLKSVVDCPGKGKGEKIDYNKIESDATLFLHENQKLIRDLKEKMKKQILKEIEGEI